MAKKKLLEKIFSICKSKKWNCICHHPNISTATIIVRFGPCSIFIFNSQNFISCPCCMSSRIICICVITWKMKRQKEYNYAMYTGFELFLFQINLIFHLLMKNWKVFQISQKRKPKFLILEFGICMYLIFIFFKNIIF